MERMPNPEQISPIEWQTTSRDDAGNPSPARMAFVFPEQAVHLFANQDAFIHTANPEEVHVIIQGPNAQTGEPDFLVFTTEEWEAFAAGVRNHEFDPSSEA